MSITRWMMLIGSVAVIGMARVAQQTALWLKAYDVGARAARVHDLENRTQWLRAELAGAESPLRLAQTSRARHLDLVAWSPMPMPVSMLGRMSVPAPTMAAGATAVAMERPQPVRLARERDGQND